MTVIGTLNHEKIVIYSKQGKNDTLILFQVTDRDVFLMILFKEKEFIPLPQLKTEICPRISTQDLLHVCELTNGNAGPKGQKKTKPRGLVMDVRLSDEYPFIRSPFTTVCNTTTRFD